MARALFSSPSSHTPIPSRPASWSITGRSSWRTRASTKPPPRTFGASWYGPYWATNFAGLYRPFTTLSFLFNYAILGNGDAPTGYHWVNFGIHAVNIALVYALAVLLLEETAPAILLAALWAVHPVLTESVTNLVGRADLLAAFGVLACLLAYVRAQRSSGKAQAAWLAAAAVAAAVGVFSKENAVVAVAILVIYDFCFAASVPWRLRWSGYAAAAVPSALYLAARGPALSGVLYQHEAFIINPLVGAGFWTSSLTAIKVIGKYLFQLVWPQYLSADYSYNAVTLFTWNAGAWEDWKAVFALAICLAGLCAALRAFRRNRLPFFAVAFFFIALSPTSNLALRIGTIMAERFLYLPSIGFFILIIGILRRWLYIRRRQNAATAVAAVVLLAAAARTHERNLDWGDQQRLWRSAQEAAPGSYKPWVLAAATAPLDVPGNLPRATAEMERGLAVLDPLPDSLNLSVAWRDAGRFYRSVGDRDTANAQQWYRKSLSMLLRSERIEMYWDEINRRENARRGRPGVTFLSHELYLELGLTWLRLSDPAHALEASPSAATRSPLTPTCSSSWLSCTTSRAICAPPPQRSSKPWERIPPAPPLLLLCSWTCSAQSTPPAAPSRTQASSIPRAPWFRPIFAPPPTTSWSTTCATAKPLRPTPSARALSRISAARSEAVSCQRSAFSWWVRTANRSYCPIPALPSVFIMIDIGFSESLCAALDWNAARSWLRVWLVLLLLVEPLAVLEPVVLLAESLEPLCACM